MVDAINKCPQLDLPGFSHAVQRETAKGFEEKSTAGFEKIVGAIDGMLIWSRCPTDDECERARTGHEKFKCTRKGKCGFNMQGICDAKRRFLYISIITAGSTSDYLSWVTCDLQHDFKTPGFLLPGYVLVGDNAYVKAVDMATPIKNSSPGPQDDYNFYHSQCRIIIECAFGILVQ